MQGLTLEQLYTYCKSHMESGRGSYEVAIDRRGLYSFQLNREEYVKVALPDLDHTYINGKVFIRVHT